MSKRPAIHASWGLVALAALLGAAGCAQMHMAPAYVAGSPSPGQQTFATENDAASALVAAAKTRDRASLDHIFGPAAKDLVSGDKVQDENAFNDFTQKAAQHMELEKVDPRTVMVDIGSDKWPFPIPIVKAPDGQWFFDTVAGKGEILARRIGANELATIKVCRAYVEAQREYASEDRDGSGVLKYAQHIISKNGHDGLYWKTTPGEEQSPFGELIAQATLEGYTPGQGKGPHPYQGYEYHILTRQGPAAAGGQYNYVINGNMIAGFALVARPAQYGSSGIMTFIISHQGKLYQKDLGPDTADIVKNMTRFNPDKTWKLVAP